MRSRTGWYPVALSDGLERSTSTGTHLFGDELVVWRDNEGTAHVWEDRCPHRGMRLSFGFVRGNQIACLYHGWRYDAAGQCRYIPAHPQLTPPESIKVEVHDSVERGGMVWARYGPSADASAPPGDLAVIPVRSLHIECPPDKAAARLATVTLPPFLAGPRTQTGVTRTTPALFSIANGGDELLIGVQPVVEAETVLHIVLAGGAEYRGAGQRHFNHWAEGLRRDLEAPPLPFSPSEYPRETAP